MKTAVFIPCIPEHFCFLNRAINALIEGPVIPNEVIVFISNADIVHQDYIDQMAALYQEYFQVFKIHRESKQYYTGEACNAVAELTNAEIIIIQAADDVPHPRRVEIVNQFFVIYDILSLNHSYWGLGDIDYYGHKYLENKTHEKLKDIQVVQPREIYEHIKNNPGDVYGQLCDFKVAAGTVAYRRQLAEEVVWSSAPHGQDTIWCKEVILKYQKSIIIDAPVYFYYK